MISILTSQIKIVGALVIMFTLVNCNRQEQMPDREHPPAPPHIDTELIVVYYFHATDRCETCLAMEEFTRTAVETYVTTNDIDVEFQSINIDLKANQPFVELYGLYGSTVVLAIPSVEADSPWVNCESIWDYYDDKEGFTAYIHSSLDRYVQSFSST